jgi:hypothetical protein
VEKNGDAKLSKKKGLREVDPRQACERARAKDGRKEPLYGLKALRRVQGALRVEGRICIEGDQRNDC